MHVGNLFHIDFGFILGRDPKSFLFLPPMRLSREMVDVMGGTQSQHYQRFKSYCYVAFISLRKSANLILNLFALMVKANVPDIAIEPDKAVMKVRSFTYFLQNRWRLLILFLIVKVQEKFRLDLSDEETIQYLQSVIEESVAAVFPQVAERIHKVAQLLKSWCSVNVKICACGSKSKRDGVWGNSYSRDVRRWG
jgi:phosphatidylinositol 3-kinase